MNKKPFFTAKRDSRKIGIFFLLFPALVSLLIITLEINSIDSLKKFTGSAVNFTGLLWVLIAVVLIFMCICLYNWVLAHREEYRVDRDGVYVYTGLFLRRAVFKSWGEISAIQMTKDPLDMLLELTGRHTGTIRIPYGGAEEELLLKDINDCSSVYQTVVDCQNDVYRDIHFPNSLRAEVENDDDEE